jgi:hypothetical protein
MMSGGLPIMRESASSSLAAPGRFSRVDFAVEHDRNIGVCDQWPSSQQPSWWGRLALTSPQQYELREHPEPTFCEELPAATNFMVAAETIVCSATRAETT